MVLQPQEASAGAGAGGGGEAQAEFAGRGETLKRLCLEAKCKRSLIGRVMVTDKSQRHSENCQVWPLGPLLLKVPRRALPHPAPSLRGAGDMAMLVECSLEDYTKAVRPG